ncbi:MAG: OB-fold nucleic acid binding domain-containing protein [Candidatus Bathyarchaeota archaeon]|nr:OB-fold nucleic acid binding domain-containing protein [Candidatus Bathyarchaeota archaeon]
MRKGIWRGRGRPPNRTDSHTDRKTLEYLAGIAVKHRIASSEFLNCILEAWKQDESECKQLIIRCRKRTEDHAIFLFTTGQKVLAQFPIQTRILQGDNQLEDYMKMISSRAPSAKNSEAADRKIRNLKAGMKKINLKARVLEIPRPKMVYTKWGMEAHVSNALIGDETGTMRMSLWNRQIEMVSEGDVIEIRNGRVVSFKGERQLRVGKYGEISAANHESTANHI